MSRGTNSDSGKIPLFKGREPRGIHIEPLFLQVICEFDKLLYHSKFSRVEKLKTVGSTYMAATGLEPGRGSNDVSEMNHLTDAH